MYLVIFFWKCPWECFFQMSLGGSFIIISLYAFLQMFLGALKDFSFLENVPKKVFQMSLRKS